MLKLAQAAAATATFGPLRIPVRLSVTGKGRVACVPQCGRIFPGGDALSPRSGDERLEVRPVERRLQGHTAGLPPGDDLLGRRARDLHEAALSQSRSSAGAGAGEPLELRAQLADGARPLGQHVVPVDRLEVHLARKEEVRSSRSGYRPSVSESA